MTVELNNKNNEFIVYILNALHLNNDQFNEAVANGSTYETIINNWCTKLFKKGMAPKDALKLIFKARNLYILRNSESIKPTVNFPSLNRYRFLKLLLIG